MLCMFMLYAIVSFFVVSCFVLLGHLDLAPLLEEAALLRPASDLLLLELEHLREEPNVVLERSLSKSTIARIL